MKRKAALHFTLPISLAYPQGTGPLCLWLGAAHARCSLAKGPPLSAPGLLSHSLPLLPGLVWPWALSHSIPLSQLGLTFRQRRSQSHGCCAALPHGPWGQLSTTATAAQRGGIMFSSLSLHPPSHPGALFTAKGKKRPWSGFPASPLLLPFHSPLSGSCK